MENSPIPDFRPNRPMDIMAFVMAQAEKRKQEETLQAQQNYRDEQKYKTFKETASAVSDFTQNVIDANAQKQLARTLALNEQMASRLAPGETTPTRVKVGDTPEGKSLLETRFMRAFPKQYASEKAKAMFDKGKEKEDTARQFEMKNMYLKGVKNPVTVNYDKINKKGYDLTGKDITDTLVDSTQAYAPATVSTVGGVNMVPRIGGTYDATSETPGAGENITNARQLAPRELELLTNTANQFMQDKAASGAIAKQADLKLVENAVNTGNWVGDASLLSNAAKGLARDVGNLSAEEQKRYMIPPSLLGTIRNRWSVWTKGVIPEADRKVFREALAVAKKVNDGILDDKRNQYAKLAIKRVPRKLDEQFAKDFIYSTEEDVPQGEGQGDDLATKLRQLLPKTGGNQ